MTTAKTILIFGDEQDEHVVHMFVYLRHASADVEILSSRSFPQTLGLSLDPLTGQWRIDLPGGRTLRSQDIQSVYWRSYDGVGEADLPDPHQRFIAENDARSLFESFLIHLPARWVNGWTAFQLHQTKPVQLARVAQLGIRVPATCLTNISQKLQQFAANQPACVYKPVQGGDHTRPLGPQQLTPQNLLSLRLAPITVQEAIPGTNVRVFVAGEQIAACEVRTHCIDYRDDPQPELLPHALPPAVADDCRRVARELHLVWTGIDFRLTPGGEYVFLEANPSPMFLGFESGAGLPLTQLLGGLLLGRPT